MSKTSPKRKRLSATSCPYCGVSGGLKKILYGMPGSDFDFEKYIVGGCCVTEKDPEIGCVGCGWEGMRGECS
jgi:hypothetical protein